MKPLHLLAASGLALTAGACGPKTPPARAALECPTAQGELTRTSAAADGKACTYAARDGAEVTLQLVAVDRGLDAALSDIETVLLAGRKPLPPEAAGRREQDKGGANASLDDGAAEAARQAEEDAEPSVRVDVGEDGAAEVVTADGGETRVSLPGIHIVANEAEESADVKVGPITVSAGGDGATIRIRRDVRLRGEALNPEKRGVRATFIYTGKDLPDGYRVVGYEAGGPRSGPITVATVKSRSERHGGDELYDDVKRLVRKNGGV